MIKNGKITCKHVSGQEAVVTGRYLTINLSQHRNICALFDEPCIKVHLKQYIRLLKQLKIRFKELKVMFHRQ